MDYSRLRALRAYKLSALSRSLSLSPMRPAAALVYLASVARVAAIEYGFPSGKSTSSFIDVNPVSVGDGILTQFEKNSSWQT